MAWGMVDVDEQRMRFVVSAIRGERSMRDLCMEFAISRPTGYLWLQRYRAEGIAGVAERSRKPHHSPARTERGVEQRVTELRRQRPDWGARKIHVLLKEEGVRLPVITIHRILLREGLVRAQDQHRPALQRFARAEPNQLWQMDFKGPASWQAPVGPLTILDDHSRYAITLRETGSTRAEGVKQSLEEAFVRCGVPEEMLMDHGTPWWNMQAATGWTWLTVWLMKQGILVQFSGFRHPQTQGKVERFHGSLEAAMQKREKPEKEKRQVWLDEFRYEYNHVRPHEALQMKTPAAVWTSSKRKFQALPKEWEYETGAELERINERGRLNVNGRRWEISRALAGERVQLVRLEGRVLVYYCRSLVREIDLAHQRTTAVVRWWHHPDVQRIS